VAAVAASHKKAQQPYADTVQGKAAPYEERNARSNGSGAGAEIEERSFGCVPRRAKNARRKKRRGTSLRMTWFAMRVALPRRG